MRFVSKYLEVAEDIFLARSSYVPCQKHSVPKGKFAVSETNSQFRIVVLEPMGLVHHQHFPLNSRQLRGIIGNHHFRRSNHNVNHPGTLHLARVLFQALFQIQLVKCNGRMRTVALENKLVFANELSIIGCAVVNDGVEVRPAGKLPMPVRQR